MKPRTKNQVRVTELAPTLPKLTDKQELWMLKQIDIDNPVRTEWNGQYATIGMACKEYMVFRVFLIATYNPCRYDGRVWGNSSHIQYSVDKELYQIWISEGNAPVIYGRYRCSFGSWMRAVYGWSYDMEIRQDRREYGSTDDLYITTDIIRIESVPKSIKKFKGFKTMCSNREARYNCNAVMNDSYFETLYKQDKMSLFRILANLPLQTCKKLIPAVKVALRNGYDIEANFRLWKDTMMMLVNLGKPVTNYACHKDMQRLHDTCLAETQGMTLKQWRAEVERIKNEEERAREIRRVERVRRQRATLDENVRKYDKKYRKRIKPYKDIVISDNKYKMQVIQSVVGFFLEGAKLNHCVYSCQYYNEKSSLIFSVRNVTNNKRKATIELAKNGKGIWTIEQCYAYGDTIHPDDKRIRDLLMNNINLIEQASKAKRKTKVVSIKREQPAEVALAA